MALSCLLDTSVWNRLDRAPALASEVTALLRRGEVGYSDIERLKCCVRRGTRITIGAWPPCFAALPKVALTETALLRAGRVQEQLVERGHHRGVKIPDLLIALQPRQPVYGYFIMTTTMSSSLRSQVKMWLG